MIVVSHPVPHLCIYFINLKCIPTYNFSYHNSSILIVISIFLSVIWCIKWRVLKTIEIWYFCHNQQPWYISYLTLWYTCIMKLEIVTEFSDSFLFIWYQRLIRKTKVKQYEPDQKSHFKSVFVRCRHSDHFILSLYKKIMNWMVLRILKLFAIETVLILKCHINWKKPHLFK